MIKYFTFDTNERLSTFYNERIIYDEPNIDNSGYDFRPISYDSFRIIVDVEKRIKFNDGSLDNDLQEIYDKLIFEQRNNKLETLL